MTSGTTFPYLRGSFLKWSILYSLIWAGFILLNITLPLLTKGHRTADELSIIFFVGGASAVLAVLTTRTAVAWAFTNRPASVRFASTFILLTVLTVGFMALMFGLHFRVYFSQWHEPFPQFYWFMQLIFTVAYSVYLFVSNTVHALVTPLNLAALLVCSWWFKPGP